MVPAATLPGVGLVTGAASGIGRTTALAFARAGCKSLALLDKNEAGLEETKRLINDLKSGSDVKIDAKTYHVDVTSADSVTNAFNSVKEDFGRLDYSVQCAGIVLITGPSAEASIEDFDLQNAVLYRGLWLCSRAALNIMRSQPLDYEAYPEIPQYRAQRGAIINVSSVIGLLSQTDTPIYSGAKAAVLGITRADAVDYAEKRIRVNAVLPALIETPMISPTPEIRAIVETAAKAKTPMKRIGMPEEVADPIIFLASNNTSFITGTSLHVDGGFSISV